MPFCRRSCLNKFPAHLRSALHVTTVDDSGDAEPDDDAHNRGELSHTDVKQIAEVSRRARALQ